MPMKNQQRKLDVYLDYYSQKYPFQNNKIIQGLCAFGLCFGILGLCWALPFPYLQFLGRYNSYFNWASFVIAISIYYYSNLSPLLSYLMLFLALIFTYVISIIEMQIPNHIYMMELFGSILLLSFVVHYLSNRSLTNTSSGKIKWNFIWIGPIWILSFLLKRFNLKY